MKSNFYPQSSSERSEPAKIIIDTWLVTQHTGEESCVTLKILDQFVSVGTATCCRQYWFRRLLV